MSSVTQGLDVCPNTMPDGKPLARSLKKIRFGPANKTNNMKETVRLMTKQLVSKLGVVSTLVVV